MIDNVQQLAHLDRLASELVVEQEKGSFSTQPVVDPKLSRPMSIQEYINFNKMNKVQTVKPKSILEHISVSTHSIKRTQSVPRPKPSILEHIHFHEANKFKTLKSDEKINDHIDKSIHSLEMTFECASSFHLNQIEELEYEKTIEKMYIFDDYPRYLDKVIRDYLATLTPRIVQIESYCEGDCADDELEKSPRGGGE